MKTEVNAIGFTLTEALEQYVDRRIRFALGTYSNYLKCVIVRLSDVNGPRGGHDKCCQIQCILPGLADVVVEDTTADLYLTINRAASRANRSVARQIKRRQSRAFKTGLPRSAMGS
ncbi:MAG: HPF/RaiA family ribosome-associated protein [Ketobacteraceae bacterium]|nr:HPF/RaiA family ribosome-associated protein [Ketobacteraceae bacterium]